MLVITLLVVIITAEVQSFEFYSSPFINVADQCINLCEDTQIRTPNQLICQRGCRFFNILRFKDEVHVNATRKECSNSCEESYEKKHDFEVCKSGCDLMAKKRQIEMASFVVFTPDDDSSNIVLAQPDLEILESDLLSDPSIRSQLEIGFNVDYKIPETDIRTMPISVKETIEKIRVKNDGDWLDCASRNSGIPRWILLSAILAAVLIALRLSFSSDKNSKEEDLHEGNNMEAWLVPSEKEVAKLDELPALLKKEEAERLAPPKYSAESEQV